jgi:hypothetical protein
MENTRGRAETFRNRVEMLSNLARPARIKASASRSRPAAPA